jgi:hypothetical protein
VSQLATAPSDGAQRGEHLPAAVSTQLIEAPGLRVAVHTRSARHAAASRLNVAVGCPPRCSLLAARGSARQSGGCSLLACLSRAPHAPWICPALWISLLRAPQWSQWKETTMTSLK